MTGDQNYFSQALLDPTVAPPENLVNPDGSQATKRFDVYRNNVTASLVEALTVGFPAIEKLVGSTNFKTLALAYVRENPPVSPVLMFYGQGFDTFVANFEHVQHVPYLADIARLELARRESYHAPDVAVFDGAQLQELGEATVMASALKATPATVLFQSPYPVYDIWLKDTDFPDHPIGSGGQAVLLTGPEFDVIATPLTHDMVRFLALAFQMPLGQAIEQTMTETPEFPLGDALTIILQTGAACRVEGKNNE